VRGLLLACVLAAIGTLLLVAGCGEDAPCVCPNCRPGGPDYFPLAVGNWWAFASDTSRYAWGSEWRIDTLSVIREDEASGVFFMERSHNLHYRWIQAPEGSTSLHTRMSILTTVDTAKVEVEGGRLMQAWVSPEDCACYTSRQEILRFPVILGDSWESRPDTSWDCGTCQDSVPADTMVVTALIARVSTPAGRFEDVYQVEARRRSSNCLLRSDRGPVLYAPGVGPIKYRWEYLRTNADVSIWGYLVDFSVGGS